GTSVLISSSVPCSEYCEGTCGSAQEGESRVSFFSRRAAEPGLHAWLLDDCADCGLGEHGHPASRGDNARSCRDLCRGRSDIEHLACGRGGGCRIDLGRQSRLLDRKPLRLCTARSLRPPHRDVGSAYQTRTVSLPGIRRDCCLPGPVRSAVAHSCSLLGRRV